MSTTATLTRVPASMLVCVRRASASLLVVAAFAFGAGGADAATFGNTAIGTTTDVAGLGYKFGSTYSLPEAGTAVSFSWYAKGGNGMQRLTPVIYRVDPLGVPSTLVVKGAEVQIAANRPAGWVTSALPATSLAAGSYVLALMSGPDGSKATSYYNVVFNGGYWNANAYGTPSSTWGQINRQSTAYSFFVTYTPAGAGAAPTNSAPPVITGTTTVGRQLTASTGTWTGSPTSYGYQWQRCNASGAACSNLPGATASTYTLAGADAGSTMRVVVTATNATGSASATSGATAVVAPAPPANSSLPVISGSAINGQALSTSNGTWTGSPTGYAYQWQRCNSAGASCSNVSGATSSTYTLVTADVGSTMRAVVTATNAGGSTPATSGPSPVVANAQSPPSNTAPPTISGTASTGQTLTATFGTWNGSPPPTLAGQWQACQSGTCTNIAGAQSTTYTVASGDVGKTLKVVVTATNPSGTASAASAPTATVTGSPPATPGLFGNNVPGSVGDQPGDGYKFGTIYRLAEVATLVDFRFYARGGTVSQAFVPAIYRTTAGGNPDTLVTKGPAVTVTAGSAAAWRTSVLPAGVTLQPGDYVLALLPGPNGQGAFVYYDPGASTAGWWNFNGYPNPSATWGTLRNSNQRWAFHVGYQTTAAAQPPVNQTAPAISGPTQVGQTLTTTNGTWTNNPTGYEYQWKRCADGTCTPISGATGTTYLIAAADEGKSLMVTVTAGNGAGESEADSAPTAAVTAPSSGPSIVPFTSFTIDANSIGATVEKALADIDGDGRLDAVIGTEYSPHQSQGGVGGIFWYRQPSSGDFADPWVKQTILPAGTAYEDMAATDIDADGRVDIVASVDTRVWWFRNPGPAGGNWQQIQIGTGFHENNMKVADLDGDGRRDVATNSALYFQNSPSSWTKVTYNDSYNGIDLLDIGSGRGRINLVGNNGAFHSTIVWFENPREHGGNARTGTWTKRTIGPGYACTDPSCDEGVPATMATADLNGDGRADTVVGKAEDEPATGGLKWYEAPADRTQPWTMRVIDDSYESTHNLGLGDIDGNGAIDLVTGEQEQSARRRVAVFYNDGSGTFVENVISTQGTHNIVLGDVEADGDLDILAGRHGWFGDTHPLLLFRSGRFGPG